MKSWLLLVLCSTALFADSVAGLKWTPPVGWKSTGSTSMRAATYPVPAVAGDKDAAECAVYFFGAGQGGSIQANMDRWKGQFTGPGGAPAMAKIAKITVHGMPVTTIDVSGAYSGMAGPEVAPVAAQGYRLLGAIIEGPGKCIYQVHGPREDHGCQSDEVSAAGGFLRQGQVGMCGNPRV